MKKSLVSFLRRNGAHLLLLVAGAALFIGGCFQNSQWFDEAYTVGLMQHSLSGVLHWATFDVHPHLYYVLLKLFTLLFGSSLPVMRLFSALGAILLASLGYTHLRRDFGKAVGFWFSFCVIFCSQTLAYALAIRMYTWAAFFVALAAIYAYRMANEPNKRNRVLFLVFALCASYTHYFGLFAAAMMQFLLLLRTRRRGENYRFWLVNSAVLLGAYLPGIVVFLLQGAQGGAMWIRIEWPDLVFDLTSYPLLGDVLKVFFARWDDSLQYFGIPYLIAGGIFLALYVTAGALLFRQIRSKDRDEKRSQAVLWALRCYFGVVLFTVTVSLFRPLWYARYSVVISGLLFFAMACLLASFRKKLPKLLAAVLLLAICGRMAYYHYDLFYDPSANAVAETLAPSGEAEDRVLPGDVFLFDGFDTFNITVWFPENDTYYFNANRWNIQNAYRAFGPKVRVLDELDDADGSLLGGRVWTNGRGDCYAHLLSLGYTEYAVHPIHLRYYDRSYEMILLARASE